MSMRLMIVDDHAGMRSTIRQLISGAGDHVLECASGDEVMVKLSEFHPDCVTMDINMAGMCAFEAMRAVRKAFPATRVICVTSHDLPDYRRAALEAGASAFVVKDNLSDLRLHVATKRLISHLNI